MQRIRFIRSPRPGDPNAQQAIWIDMEVSVVTSSEDPLPETLLWVDYEEVILEIEKRGDKPYADFFRKLRNSPGGSFAPGLCIMRDSCEVVA